MPRFGVWEYLILLIAVVTVFGYIVISLNKKSAAMTRRSSQMGVGSWALIIVAMVAYYIAVRPVVENVGRSLMDHDLLFPAILLCLGVLAPCVWLARRNARRRSPERIDARTWVLFAAIMLAGETVVEPRARNASQFLADRGPATACIRTVRGSWCLVGIVCILERQSAGTGADRCYQG